MTSIQQEIAEEAVFKDDFNFNLNDSLTVVGVDQGFTDSKSVSCAVAMKNGGVVEQFSAAEEVSLPYIPGLLAFQRRRKYS